MVEIKEDSTKQYYRIINLISEDFNIQFDEFQTTLYNKSRFGIINFFKGLFTKPLGTVQVSYDRKNVEIWGDREIFRSVSEKLELNGINVIIYD